MVEYYVPCGCGFVACDHRPQVHHWPDGSSQVGWFDVTIRPARHIFGHEMNAHGNAAIQQNGMYLNNFGENSGAGYNQVHGLPLPLISGHEHFPQLDGRQDQAHGLPIPPFGPDGWVPRSRGGGISSRYKSPAVEPWEPLSNSDNHLNGDVLADTCHPTIEPLGYDNDHEPSRRHDQRAPHSHLGTEAVSFAEVVSGRTLSNRSPQQRRSRGPVGDPYISASSARYERHQHQPPVKVAEFFISDTDHLAIPKSEADHEGMNRNLGRERRQSSRNSSSDHTSMFSSPKGPTKDIFRTTSLQESQNAFKILAVNQAGLGLMRARRPSGIQQSGFVLATSRKNVECRRRHVPRRSIRNGVYRRHRGTSPLWRPYPVFQPTATHNSFDGIRNAQSPRSWLDRLAGQFRRTEISRILGLHWMMLVVLFFLDAAVAPRKIMSEVFILRLLVLGFFWLLYARWFTVYLVEENKGEKTDVA